MGVVKSHQYDGSGEITREDKLAVIRVSTADKHHTYRCVETVMVPMLL